MNIKVTVEIPRELPIRQLESYIDKTVYNAARITLDFTNTKHKFPYRTGDLNRASMAEGVVGEGNKTYHLGARGVDYAKYVWDYPQSTNWTNPNTYAKWYMTEFKNDQEIIMNQAINNALRGLK